MLDIKQVSAALRLRRRLNLIENNLHPLHDLLQCLCNDNDYFEAETVLDIEEVTRINLKELQFKKYKDYESPEWQLETDLTLQSNIIMSKVTSLVRPRKLRSREALELNRRGLYTLHDVLLAPRAHADKLVKIARCC